MNSSSHYCLDDNASMTAEHFRHSADSAAHADEPYIVVKVMTPRGESTLYLTPSQARSMETAIAQCLMDLDAPDDDADDDDDYADLSHEACDKALNQPCHDGTSGPGND